MKKLYRLIKDTPEMPANSIVEYREEKDSIEAGYWNDEYDVWYRVKCVEEQPEWFERVYALTLPEKAFAKFREMFA